MTQAARVLFFIDNEGVKEAFVKGATKPVASRTMLVEAMLQDASELVHQGSFAQQHCQCPVKVKVERGL